MGGGGKVSPELCCCCLHLTTVAAAASTHHIPTLHTPCLIVIYIPLYYLQIIKSYLACVNGVIIRGLLAWGEGDGGR